MTDRTTDPNGYYARLLQRTFRGSPGSFLRWMGINKKGRKVLRTEHRAPSLKDFLWHVADAKPHGIGLKPAFRLGQEGAWHGEWAMLDFDEVPPEQLVSFMDWMTDRWGVFPLFNRGSTGRGAHVWVLLDRPIPLKTLHQFLVACRDETRRWDVLGKPAELRPSNGVSDRGMGVILPYRGCAENGFGPQCLYDAETGEALSLDDLQERPRSPVTALLEEGRLAVRPRPVRVRAPTALIEDEQAWQTELERVGEAYEEGNRQHLVLGLTAYGCRLGLPPEQVAQDVLWLCEVAGDDELPMRREAISGTLQKHAEGRRTAISFFYHLAGVTPLHLGVPPEVLALVGQFRAIMLSFSWQGHNGFSARSVYLHLLRLAFDHGHPHPQGIEIEVSWRQLMELADLGGRDTLKRSLAYLDREHLVIAGRPSVGTKSGSLILLKTDRNTRTISATGAPEKTWPPAFRAGKRRLGKRKEAIFDLILVLGAATLADLSQRLGRPPGDLREPVRTLVQEGLLSDDAGTLTPAPNWAEAIHAVEHLNGAAEARRHQRARHQQERDHYRQRLDRLAERATWRVPGRPIALQPRGEEDPSSGESSSSRAD